MKKPHGRGRPPAVVGIIMGSTSDVPAMQPARDILEEFGIGCEFRVVSAHRTPTLMFRYAGTAARRGLRVIIAGAGGAAHLPGMVASRTSLPVIGVPIKTRTMDGLDSLLSIAQMPPGIPVAAMAVNGAANAGLLAVRILSVRNPALGRRMDAYRDRMRRKVLAARIEA
ncbi:MAG: 5-(carboxyamino)imidazole ribonucleotide mutase [Bacteroidota bacterium]